MKRILKKSFLGIPIGIIAAVLVGIVVLAAGAWTVTHLTGTGKLTVSEPPPAVNFDYTITPANLAFGNPTAYAGGDLTLTATATVHNIGNQNITGFTLSNINCPPWMVGTPLLIVSGGPIASGASGTVTFTLTGTAPGAGDWFFANTSCDLTPTGP